MRLGLVGFGNGGQRFHLPYVLNSGWDLAGVVTRSEGRRADLARLAPGVRAFDSLDDLLDAGVDAVTITTPPETRRELVLRALERGAHVVADKPFAPDAATARELAAAAERAGRLLTVFHNRRWDTDIATLEGVLSGGELGAPWRAVNRFDIDERGTLEVGPAHGLLRDLGSHTVDQMTHLFGPVARVDAHLDWAEIDGQRVDAGFTISMHHRSGAHSTVSSSKINSLTERELIVYGANGSYVSRMSDVQARQVSAGVRPGDPGFGVEDEKLWPVLHTERASRAIPSAAADATAFYDAFLASVRDGSPLAVTLEQAIHTVEVTDAARVSALESRSVALPA